MSPMTQKTSSARLSPDLLWNKQSYHYEVQRWLDGDPRNRRHRRSAASAAITTGSTSITPT